jgi:hypothetical protein
MVYKYIKELYENKDLRWLKEEYKRVKRIIENEKKQLKETFLLELEKNRIKQNLEYNEKLLIQIEKYIKELEKNLVDEDD